MPTFKDMLKQLRNKENLSQSELAEKLGVAKSTISMYEVGKREPDFVTLEAISDFFNVDMNYLLGKIGSENQHYFSNAVTINVLGRVAAGIPLDAIEEIIDTEEISQAMASDGEYFGLRISGDSMEPRIKDGDIVIVRKQSDADDGDLVIALINGNDAVCKRIKKYAEGIALISNNPKYDPMFFSQKEIDETPISIIGKVKELRAKF